MTTCLLGVVILFKHTDKLYKKNKMADVSRANSLNY